MNAASISATSDSAFTDRKSAETALRDRERKFRAIRDISDRKAAEHLILEQAMLLNIATDAILVRDLANRIRFWSNGAERIYGWSAIEAIDRDVNALLYQDPSFIATTAFD